MKSVIRALVFISATALAACDDPGVSSAVNRGGGGVPGGGGAGGAGDPGPDPTCTDARAQVLGAIDTVSTGAVTVVDRTDGVTTLYVDATAGGAASASMNPWLFTDLATDTKSPLTDVEAAVSTGWDLAFKRAGIYTNSGHGGPGQGGAALVAKEFATVTASDAAGAAFGTEMLFDAACNPNLDPTGAAVLTFSTWYAYDEATHMLSPAPGTWLVRGAAGALYKLVIETYYSAPGGGAGVGAGANYRLRVSAL